VNQTKKRLSIIKIAISITDIETIQLQVLKLGLLRTDEKIQEIIQMLQAENYAQAQGLITTYIEMPTEEILQRSAQKKEKKLTKEEQSTIDEFQLFITPNEHKEHIKVDINDYVSDDLKIPKHVADQKQEEAPLEVLQEIDINDFPTLSPLKSRKQTKPIATDAFDSLLNMDANDVLKDNINLDISHTEDDNFFGIPHDSSPSPIETSSIPKDTFFDIDEAALSEKETAEDTLVQDDFLQEAFLEEDFLQETLPEEKHEEDEADPFLTLIPVPEQEKKTATVKMTVENSKTEENIDTETIKAGSEKSETPSYKSIPYITQKLESMNKQYPSSHYSSESFPSLSKLLTKIGQESITEAEIEETLAEVKRLAENASYAQAAQLLLVCAATPSPFAQLMLARELYRGTLLTQNIPQAFILLNTLAMDDYPEALCDLGQFYENGIGSKKDKKRAQELYKHAMDLGIKRAKNHFERLNQSKKGFFSK